MHIFKYLGFILLYLAQTCICFSQQQKSSTSYPAYFTANNEVIYHVVQRSFYDSNGDMQGDLKGLKEKLDYLQDLGITSIQLLPLYESVYYHNYFSGNFEKIDTEFGTMKDYIDLVKDIHRRGMKLYLDMETQYVTEDHLWYKDSYKNPGSHYSNYLVYNGPGNTDPESIIFNLKGLTGYNGVSRKITTVNLNSPDVKEYNYKLFHFFTDPNNDGRFDDGADGFRLDHMMDDLDDKHKWTNLFATFWSPLIHRLKTVNPRLKFVAEQANWASMGFDYLEKGGVDRVFAFRIAFEIRNLNKTKLAAVSDSLFSYTPPGKQQVVFIENHDMPRFAYVAHKNPGIMRVGAALNLLIGGIPSIYYGQELGMYGSGGWMKYGMNDANEIPDREAFEWYKADTGKGMATWYKNTGPWWDSTNLIANDGISLEEERNDPNSLFNFYKELIRLRKSNKCLTSGAYKTLDNNNDSVYTFLRYRDAQGVIVAVNLSGKAQKVVINCSKGGMSIQNNITPLWGADIPVVKNRHISITLLPYSIDIWKVR